jgi:hypothetical protein
MVVNVGSCRGRVAVGWLLVALVVSVPTSVAAQNLNPEVLPAGARPHGATYGKWGARWWQWVVSAPAATNPLLDTTGEDCAVGQTGKVWFLAGTAGAGSVVRTCTVPTGTSLFFPVLNAAFIATEPFETEPFVHEQVAGFVDTIDVSTMAVEVDGQSIEDLGSYRAHSPTFSVTLPAGNIFGVPAGTLEPSAADGYWLMLRPLAPGEHTVHIHGVPDGGVLDVTYNLVVAHP